MTVAALMKQVNHDFAPYMEALGFKRIPRKAVWVKRLDNVYHTVYFGGSGWGGSFSVAVSVWTPGLLGEHDDKSEKAAVTHLTRTLIGGTISPSGIGGGYSFAEYGKTPEEDQATLLRLVEVMQQMLVPWLAMLSTVDGIVKHLKAVGDTDGLARRLQGSHNNRIPEDPYAHLIDNSVEARPYPIAPTQIRAYCPRGFLHSSMAEQELLISEGFGKLIECLSERGFQFVSVPEFRFLREVNGIWHEVRPFVENDGLHMWVEVSIWFPEMRILSNLEPMPGPPTPVEPCLLRRYISKDGVARDPGPYWPIWGSEKLTESALQLIALFESSVEQWYAGNSSKEVVLRQFTFSAERQSSALKAIGINN